MFRWPQASSCVRMTRRGAALHAEEEAAAAGSRRPHPQLLAALFEFIHRKETKRNEID